MTNPLPSPSYSVVKEVALFLSLIGSAVGLVGLVATDWAVPDRNKETNSIQEVGLWRYCKWIDPQDTSPQACFMNKEIFQPGWFRATQVLSVFGFILETLTLALIIASECVRGCRQKPGLVFAFVGTGFGAALFVASALVVFASEIEDATFGPTDDVQTSHDFTYKISWAYILFGVGAGLQPICAILGIWDAASNKRKNRSQSVTEDGLSGHHPYGSMDT